MPLGATPPGAVARNRPRWSEKREGKFGVHVGHATEAAGGVDVGRMFSVPPRVHILIVEFALRLMYFPAPQSDQTPVAVFAGVGFGI
jgi:hypothetical protein